MHNRDAPDPLGDVRIPACRRPQRGVAARPAQTKAMLVRKRVTGRCGLPLPGTSVDPRLRTKRCCGVGVGEHDNPKAVALGLLFAASRLGASIA
jgi:hypothetical protein